MCVCVLVKSASGCLFDILYMLDLFSLMGVLCVYHVLDSVCLKYVHVCAFDICVCVCVSVVFGRVCVCVFVLVCCWVVCGGA